MPLKTLSEALVCSKQMFLSEHEEILKKKNQKKQQTKHHQQKNPKPGPDTLIKI